MKKFSDKLVCLILSMCIMFFILTAYVGIAKVDGSSMEPSFANGDFIIYSKIATTEKLEKGDIVLFRNNGSTLIKRVVALEGDRVNIHDDKLFVNDEESVYLSEEVKTREGDLGADFIINKNRLFVMGDNRENSIDSRDSSVSQVPTKNVFGKVMMIVKGGH